MLILLGAAWLAWGAPFLWRIARTDGRAHVVSNRRVHAGFWFQTAACAAACLFRIPAASTPRVAAFAVLAPAAIALAWWSTRSLGRQFAVHAGLYADHQLVRSGAYALVRHPIYASVLLMWLATAALITRWEAWLPLAAVLLIGTEIRVRGEDGLLARRFGKEFEEYRRATRAYVPFVR
ncbi:MAG: isoprenylcysteine carboxylmethyltransferase family protein [Bryobacteraceae bacterium]